MLKRRELITALGRSSLMLTGLAVLPACSREDEVSEIEGPPLELYARGMQSISYIGPACLSALGLDPASDPASLEAGLLDSLESRLALSENGTGLAEAIDREIRRDFENGNVLEVAQWQLSDTECRLAALAAVLQGQRTPEVPAPPAERDGFIADIENWGPRFTIQGETFNTQPDGHSGFWIKAKGAAASVIVRFDGKDQRTVVYPEVLTSGLRGKFMKEIINTPGSYEVELYDKARRLRQKVGDFTVKPASP
jgi:hypothetical protein